MVMAIIGICGKMGKRLYEYYKDSFTIIGIDKNKHEYVKTYNDIFHVSENIDIIVDFSSPDSYYNLSYALLKKIPILSGTTGFKKSDIASLEEISNLRKTSFIWKPNFAKGINLFSKLLEISKDEFPVLDFVEIHATTKKDAPSGTAKMLAERIEYPIEKIQSLRLNMAPAIHEIIFSSSYERIILRHEIIDKDAFIIGFNEELNHCLE